MSTDQLSAIHDQLLNRLAETEQLLNHALDSVQGLAGCSIDLQGRVVAWSASSVLQTGYAECEAVGATLAELYSASDCHNGFAGHSPESNGFEQWEAITACCSKAGNPFHARFSYRATRNTAGAVTGYSVLCKELPSHSIEKPRSPFETAIGQWTTHIASIFNSLPIGIAFARDAEGLHIAANDAFAELLGLERGLNFSKIARPSPPFRCFDAAGDEIPGDQLPMQQAARRGITIRAFDLTIVHDSGRTVRLLEYAIPLFDESSKLCGAIAAFVDITHLKKLESLHRFLVQLDDSVRPLTDAGEITATTARLLGEYLNVSRCAYGEIGQDGDQFTTTGDYVNGVQSIVGNYRLSQFGESFAKVMRESRTHVVRDAHQEVPAADLASYLSAEIVATICVPLEKEGRLVAVFAVHQNRPRAWSSDEIELIESVANRCWESLQRARVSHILEQSEAKYRQLVNAVPLIVWEANPAGTVDYLNDRWYEFSGLNRSNADRHHWTNAIAPDDLSRLLQLWEECVQSGIPFENEVRMRKGDSGEYRWFLVRALPMRDEHGRIVRWFGTSTDIHDFKLAKQAVIANEERFRLLVEAVHDHALFKLDPDGRVSSWNVGAMRISGYTAEEIIGHPLGVLLPQNDREALDAAHFLKIAVAQGRCEYTGECVRRDGSRFWADVQITALRNEAGTVRGFASIVHDRTQHRRAEERFQMALQSSPGAMVLIDQRGTIVLANVQAEALFGYQTEEIAGSTIEVLLPNQFAQPVDCADERDYLRNPIVRSIGSNHYVIGRSKDGREFPAEVTLNPIQTEKEFLILCSIVDVTEKKKADEQRREHLTEMAHVGRLTLLGQMISGLAHEINQPLAAAANYGRACVRFARSKLDMPSSELVPLIEKSIVQSERACEIVKRLGQFVSKGQTIRVSVDINAAVKQVVELAPNVWSQSATTSAVSLRAVLEDNLPRVLADRVQIDQVLLNLIRNAVEAAQHPAATEQEVEVRTLRDGNSVRISVLDRGPGMPPEASSQVFKPFFTTKPDGIGLGLTISKSIIEAHNGYLWVEPNKGGGSIFTFTLPMQGS